MCSLADQRCNIEDCLRQMDACFNLLLPRFEIPETGAAVPSTSPAGKVKSHKLRRRTHSSGSFASLGSSDFSDSDEEFGGEEMGAEFGVSRAKKGSLLGENSGCQTKVKETETAVGVTNNTGRLCSP